MTMLNAEDIRQALSIRDLTDPRAGAHAMQSLVDALVGALRLAWGSSVVLHRGGPIVSVADNYDRLRYPADAIARDARYTRYVCDVAVLRTQTSALVPPVLRGISRDTLLACPGMVYRRDSIDRLHTGNRTRSICGEFRRRRSI